MADTVTRWTKIDDLPEYLCVDEVAAYLDLSRNGAYALIQSGAIPSQKFGRLIRVPRSAVAPRTNNEERQ